MTTTIPPFGSKVVKLRFKPTAFGVREGNLTFTSNAEGSPHNVTLLGTGFTNNVDPPGPNGPLTYLTAKGATLYTESGAGEPYIMRSVNWYGFEQQFIPGGAWSRPFRTKVVGGVEVEGMLDEIKRLGFNSLRLLFSEDCTWPDSKPETRFGFWNTTYISPIMNGEFLNNPTPQNPQDVKTSLQIMDMMVNWCEDLGIRIVFDLHCLAPDDSNVLATNGKWYTTTTPDAPGATAGVKREPRNEAQAIAAHVFLANRYKGRPVVCGFDLINEPHNCTWDRNPLTGIVGFYERAAEAIHAVNPDVLIVCEGVAGNVDHTPPGHENDPESQQGLYQWGTIWSGDLYGARTMPVQVDVPGKLMYSPHEYGAYLDGFNEQPWFDPVKRVGPGYAGKLFPDNMPDVWRVQWGYLAEENIAPLYIGEFGSYFRVGGDPVGRTGSDYTALNLSKDRQWINKLAAYCSDFNINFAYWCWNPGGIPDGLVGSDSSGNWGPAQKFKLDIIAPFLLEDAENPTAIRDNNNLPLLDSNGLDIES